MMTTNLWSTHIPNMIHNPAEQTFAIATPPELGLNPAELSLFLETINTSQAAELLRANQETAMLVLALLTTNARNAGKFMAELTRDLYLVFTQDIPKDIMTAQIVQDALSLLNAKEEIPTGKKLKDAQAGWLILVMLFIVLMPGALYVLVRAH